MYIVAILLVWISGVLGGNETACLVMNAIKDSEEWIGYPGGWRGYDGGRGGWAWLPIREVGTGVLAINQEYDNEIWIFVMRSSDNHDFCGPIVIPLKAV